MKELRILLVLFSVLIASSISEGKKPVKSDGLSDKNKKIPESKSMRSWFFGKVKNLMKISRK